MNKQQQIEKMKNKETQNNVFDILDKIEFFQGQRAGRELWNDKPKEVQDKDISDFVRDINYIRSYLQDSVVLSREEYEKLKHFENRVRSGVCLTQKEWFDFCNEDSNRRTCLRIEEREKARKETAEEILNAVVGAIDNGTFFRQNFIFMMNKVYGVEVQNANNDKTIEQANKKIVRQFYNKIQKMLDETRQVIEEPCNGRQNAGYCVADVDNGLKELAKQFGVEIKGKL